MWMETSKANMWIIECVAIKRSRKTSELRGLYGIIPIVRTYIIYKLEHRTKM